MNYFHFPQHYTMLYLLRLTEQNTAGDTELTCEAFSIISNQRLYDSPALGSDKEGVTDPC